MLRFSATRALLVCGALVVVAQAADAQAQRQQRGLAIGFPAGLPEARLMKQMTTTLDMDEKTVEELNILIDEVSVKEERLREETLAAAEKIKELLNQDLPDEEELMTAAATVDELSRKSRELRIQCSLRVRALLSPEQLEKFMERRSQSDARRQRAAEGGRRGGKRGGKRGGQVR